MKQSIKLLVLVPVVACGVLSASTATVSNAAQGKSDSCPPSVSKKVLNKALGKGWSTDNDCYVFTVYDEINRAATMLTLGYTTKKGVTVMVRQSQRVDPGMNKTMMDPSLGTVVYQKRNVIVKEFLDEYAAARKVGKKQWIWVKDAPNLRSAKILIKSF